MFNQIKSALVILTAFAITFNLIEMNKTNKPKEQAKIKKSDKSADNRKHKKKRDQKEIEKRISSRDFLEIIENSSSSDQKHYEEIRADDWISNRNTADYDLSSQFVPKSNLRKS